MDNSIVFDDLRTTPHYDIAGSSGIGKRESQQDSAYVAADDNSVFAVICDGMGGYSGGQDASRAAIESMVGQYALLGDKPVSAQWLRYAAEITDDVVYSLTGPDGRRLHCGTTLVVASIQGDRLSWLSVGDSRIYIVRANEMIQVTSDHNYYLRLIQQLDKGEITQAQYDCEAVKGDALTSFIGMGGLQLIDINETPFQLERGDFILLCSDGLYRSIPEHLIKKIILSNVNANDVVRQYNNQLQKFNNLYQDNYTYVAIRKV